MTGAAVAPDGFLLCDGSSVLRTDYAALFAAIGVAYGAVDGTHFTLPDLRQRFAMGKAAAGTGNTLGATGGMIDHVHSIDPPATNTGSSGSTVAATPLLGNASSSGHIHSVNIPAFDSDADNPPYQVVNYIIKV